MYQYIFSLLLFFLLPPLLIFLHLSHFTSMPLKSNLSISLPLRTRIQLTLLNLVTDSVRRHDGTINRRLINFVDRRVPSDPTPRNRVSTHDITVNAVKNVWFRLFVPDVTSSLTTIKLPVIVFFHGGGFSLLSAASNAYDAVCRRFARKLNAVIVSVEYRLAPEYKFPCQYEDGFDVLKYIDAHRQEIHAWPEHADVSECFIAGDSAGGNIAHHLSVQACSTRFETLRVIGLINIQPFFGGKERLESEVRLEGAPVVSLARTEWLWRAFLPEGEDLDHWAVNVCGPNAVDISGSGYPPTIVFVGGFDPLQDWQRKYYEWLKSCGKDVKLVEYPTAIHAFYVFPELPESGRVIIEIQDFINKQCSKVRGHKLNRCN